MSLANETPLDAKKELTMIPQHYTQVMPDCPHQTVEEFVASCPTPIARWCYWYAVNDESTMMLCMAVQGVGMFPVFEYDEPRDLYYGVLLFNSEVGVKEVNRMNLERFEIWPNEAHAIAQSTVREE